MKKLILLLLISLNVAALSSCKIDVSPNFENQTFITRSTDVFEGTLDGSPV